MPGPTKDELAGELSTRLRNLEAAFEAFKTLTEFRIDESTRRAAERDRVDQEVQKKLADLAANDAAFTQTARMLEKLSDRSWGLGEKVLVTLLSLICGALLTLFIQSMIRR